MEEKPVKTANNRGSIIAKLGIGCVVCLLLGFAILLYAQEKTKSAFIATKPEIKETNTANAKMQAMAKAKAQTQPQRNQSWGRQNRGQNRGGSVDFGENAAFYKTIIDHNIFRPLGWTPPNNEPAYSLLGTKAVDANGAISQATLLEKRSNRHHFVTIGTKLGDITVTDIQAERVTLDKAGETITLKIGGLQLLTAKRGRSGDRGGDREEGGSDNNERNRDNQADAKKREQEEQRERANTEQNRRREMMERFRNASGEERRRMIERFRGGRGDRGRRGRGRD